MAAQVQDGIQTTQNIRCLNENKASLTQESENGLEREMLASIFYTTIFRKYSTKPL